MKCKNNGGNTPLGYYVDNLMLIFAHMIPSKALFSHSAICFGHMIRSLLSHCTDRNAQ